MNSAQQKRQNSVSAYMNNPSSKRTPNPLQMQLSMQSNVPGASQLGANSSSSPSGRFVPSAQRGKYRKSVQFPTSQPQIQLQQQQQNQQPYGPQLIKTPTPSNYDVPSSPNVTHSTAQNNSDSSGSSPMVDSMTPGNATQNKESSTVSVKNTSMPLQQQPSVQSEASSASQQRVMTDEEQQLAAKLKETYKNIVSFEEIVQKSIVDLTHKINQSSNFYSPYSTSMYVPQHQALHGSAPSFQAAIPTSTTDLSNNLWTIYHHNITLLNNYYDFLTTALKPTSLSTHHKTGKNIIDLYKIPRRMWVYGIVGFLELLKNIMSIFQDHEGFSCFIAHCFSIVSSLTDPSWEMEGWWCEKLGDLSRMAIALYSSRFIDWKSSSEYWYWNALKTLYGHGKMYYHMSTVQQDNLEALVNISKAVNCRDPFVPTSQYLELVVENICTQRNILSLLELPIIDFIKIHKVLLCINNNNSNSQNQGDVFQEGRFNHGVDLVSRYAMSFGSDSHGYNFFLRQFIYPTQSDKQNADPFTQYLKQQHEQDQNTNSMDTIEKINFWFNKGPLFAIANINHLIGFGDARNPFAKLFLLPEALRERKDKKERKRKTKSTSQDQNSIDEPSQLSNGVDSSSVTGSDLSSMDWFYCLAYLDKSVLELNFRILKYYLVGPKRASACHIIVWLYFLIAVGEAIKRFPESRNMFLWLFQKFFPWEAFINYMNSITGIVRGNAHLNNKCREYIINHPNYVQYFNENEQLSEVWKCWGTLWFDFICVKHDYEDFEAAGIRSHAMFDHPICGTSAMMNLNNLEQDGSKSREQGERDNEERLVRIVLLGRFLADNYEFGFMRDKESFKFDNQSYEASKNDVLCSFSSYKGANDIYQFINEVFYEDSRLNSGSFVTPISSHNLGFRANDKALPSEVIDESWFQIAAGPSWLEASGSLNFGQNVPNQESMEGYADTESDENGIDLDSICQTGHLDNHHLYHHSQHRSALMSQQRGDVSELYDNSLIMEGDLLPSLKKVVVEGNLGDRMDTSLTYITFDTNIWLKHCGRIFKCAHSGAFKVSIPLIVYQELRSLRKSTEATIADAATRSVIIIRELYASKEIVVLRFDGTITSDLNEVAEFENNPSWLNNVDSTVLNIVTEHDQINKKQLRGLNATLRGTNIILDEKMARVFRYCILITDDRNMRLRAKTTGLSSFQSRWLFGQLESISSNMCID
ncbi:hypothetical protein FDK38_000509 [Candidozyma auris]|nr:hypothetical protein FDK38_000509 [[Candida] auris]